MPHVAAMRNPHTPMVIPRIVNSFVDSGYGLLT
jgi:hypothetical protein